MDYDRELFGEITKFVEIEIKGRQYQVPDQLELLRVFQFLNFSIDYARLCWNASCQRCFIEYEKKSKSFKALSCRTKSFEAMKITQLPDAIREGPPAV
ncbi:MAG: hypothetical protein ACO3LE_00040 [Bdellovibrionota bacterium]